MKTIDVISVGLLCLASAALGLVVGTYGAARREAVCREHLNDTLDFIGLVVDDVEESIERAGAVVGSSGMLIEGMHRRAKEAPIPARREYRERAVAAAQPDDGNDLQTACVGSGSEMKCYVQVDGAWGLLEVEP